MQAAFEAVIGIESHVRLSTKTKAFCACANVYGAKPNTHVCPVCLAHPVRASALHQHLHARVYFLGLIKLHRTAWHTA